MNIQRYFCCCYFFLPSFLACCAVVLCSGCRVQILTSDLVLLGMLRWIECTWVTGPATFNFYTSIYHTTRFHSTQFDKWMREKLHRVEEKNNEFLLFIRFLYVNRLNTNKIFLISVDSFKCKNKISTFLAVHKHEQKFANKHFHSKTLIIF